MKEFLDGIIVSLGVIPIALFLLTYKLWKNRNVFLSQSDRKRALFVDTKKNEWGTKKQINEDGVDKLLE